MTNVPLPPGQVIGLVLSVVLDHVRPALLPGQRTRQRLAGSTLTLAGCLIIGSALRERRRAAEEPFDLERPDSLVTTGPYALTRHPLYLGWWLIHLGVGVFRGSAWVLATLPVAILAEHPSVLAEEADLTRRFGNDYDAYRARVARYARIGWPDP